MRSPIRRVKIPRTGAALTGALAGFSSLALFWGAASFLGGGLGPSALIYDAENQTAAVLEDVPPPRHLPTPEAVKGIYMTSWVASTGEWRESLLRLIDETEANALVVDVKDYTGKISFLPADPVLRETGSGEGRIHDIRAFTDELHRREIYAIARIAVFQDPYFVSLHPEFAVQSRKYGEPWKDRKGLTWLDVCARGAWEYAARVAEEATRAGFDELNFDYIRFPSDGVIEDMIFQCPEGQDKPEALETFFRFLDLRLAGTGVPLSADLFGLTTTAEHGNDLNIGQILERAAPHFDYIAPMVYPSHYPPGYEGYRAPAEHPYEVVHEALVKAATRLGAVGLPAAKLRPWLQDFDLGADYDATAVRAQIQATYDAGLTSWMLWDPGNVYTTTALKRE